MVKAILHSFQEKAVQELLKKGTKQIVENNTVKDTMENPIIFSSPTGSGKTIMSISFIQRLNNYLKQNISNVVESMKVLGHDLDSLNSNVIEKELNPLFIYFVPSNGDLGGQIFNEISSHGSNVLSEGEEILNVVEPEAILNINQDLKENSVMVVTWDKYIKKNNKVNQYTENNTTSTQLDLLISSVTKNRPIIALIDEAHSHFNDKAKSVVSRFKPDLLVKISATPKESYKDTDAISKDVLNRTVLVPILDVRNSGLIKDKIEIISNINGVPLTMEKCIEEAVKLQEQLTSVLHYEILNNIAKGRKLTVNNIQNPLILIQIDNDSEFKNSKQSEVKNKLKTLGFDDSEILTWFSGGKPTKKQLDGAKVLIFKTAIALGWDYPRSHILVKLRETKSKSFDIQTIGRITRLSNGRNSLQNRYHDDRLRTGYVFVENGLTSTDFDDTVESLLGKFVYIDSNTYSVKEVKQESLNKFNQIGLKNGVVTKIKVDKDDVVLENIKQTLNVTINNELTNKQNSMFNFNKDFSININSNYTGEVEDVFKGEYNFQNKQLVNINEIATLKDMLFSVIFKNLKNSKLKEYAISSENVPSLSRRQVNESFTSIIQNNKKIKSLLIQNDFPYETKLEKDKSISIFLLNNQTLLIDIITQFENLFVRSFSKSVIVEGSVFSIKNSIYIDNNDFSVSNEQDGWLYKVIPNDISKTSTEENDFLKFLINNENVEFVYKNGTGKDDFNIVYQDKVTHKNKNYYPDFIVVTKSNKIIIIDYKQEAVDQSIFEKFSSGKHFESGNKQLVLDTQYNDLIVTMAVDFSKKGNEPTYKYLNNNSYISVDDDNHTRYWSDINLLLK